MVLAALDLKLVLAEYVVKECYERTKYKDFFPKFSPYTESFITAMGCCLQLLLEGDVKRYKVPHTLWRK